MDLYIVSVDHLEKTNKEPKSLKQQEIKHYIYQNEVDKACFKHDMAYGDFKDLTRWTGSYKILREKGFSFAKNPKYNWYQMGLVSVVYRVIYKKVAGGAI